MKICSKCKQVLQDDEQFCNRCGGVNFMQPNNNQRPQGQQMQGQRQMQQGQRPQMQGQRPTQQMGQRPNQNINMQRTQGQQMQGQRQMQQRPQGNPMQNMNNQQIQSQQMYNANMENFVEEDIFSENIDEGNITQNNGKKTKIPKENIASADGSSVKDWILTLVFMIIPVWNILYIVKTLKSPETPDFKRNYLKAFLIYFAVAFGISLIFSMMFASAIINLLA